MLNITKGDIPVISLICLEMILSGWIGRINLCKTLGKESMPLRILFLDTAINDISVIFGMALCLINPVVSRSKNINVRIILSP